MPVRDIDFLHLGLRPHSVGRLDCEFCPTSGRTTPYPCEEPGCTGVIHFELNDYSFSEMSGVRYIVRCDVVDCGFNKTIKGI
jgi:hypothetical protein